MKNLAAKMVAAVNDIDAVTKRGKNEKQGYAYVKAADVAQEVRGVLVKHGIAFDYHVVSAERWEKATNSGGLMYFCQLEVATTFTDSESGEAKTVNGLGWGMDTGDKAPYKAMTGALKYALRMNFLIPDESDPENDSADKSQKQVQATNGHTPDPVSDYFASDPEEFNQEQRPKSNGKPKPELAPRSPGRACTEKQSKLFLARAISNGKKDGIGNYLASIGCTEAIQIPEVDFDNALIWASTK